MPKANALVEVFHAFTEATVAEAAHVDRQVLVGAKQWYDVTVGEALAQHPAAWTKAASAYVLKHVRRIGRMAGNEAAVSTGGDITKEILDHAVKAVIEEQQQVCLRLAKVKSADRSLHMIGIFCKRVQL